MNRKRDLEVFPFYLFSSLGGITFYGFNFAKLYMTDINLPYTGKWQIQLNIDACVHNGHIFKITNFAFIDHFRNKNLNKIQPTEHK